MAPVIPLVEEQVRARLHGAGIFHGAVAGLVDRRTVGRAGRHQQLGRNFAEVLNQRLRRRKTLGRQTKFLAVDGDAHFQPLGVDVHCQVRRLSLFLQCRQQIGDGQTQHFRLLHDACAAHALCLLRA